MPENHIRNMASLIAKVATGPQNIPQWSRKAFKLWREGGWGALQAHLWMRSYYRDFHASYATWVRDADTLTSEDRRRIEEHLTALAYQPRISIVMPVYNVDQRWLELAIESVRAQLYPHWELCVGDDCSTAPHVRRVLEHYANMDPRIRVVFRERNGHISAASNSALALATGEFVALLDNDDELAPHALYAVVVELNAFPLADLLYSDEDIMDEDGRRSRAYFKPEWQPDLFYGHNMVSHLGVYRTALLRRLEGFRLGYEGSQDYDLVLRVVEQIPPDHIRHIPQVLYHWRAIPGSAALHDEEKEYAPTAARRAITDHLQRKGIAATVSRGFGSCHRVRYPVPEPPPLVSFLVWAGKGDALLRESVNALLAHTTYAAVEVLEVAQGDPAATYSAAMNAAARRARGEILGLLAPGLRPLQQDWLNEMVSQALRPDIGVVGAKLLYPSRTVLHGGFVLNPESIVRHAHEHFPRAHSGYLARAQLVQSFAAVSGACLIVRRSLWMDVGGLDEAHLDQNFSDVDLCLRVRETGHRTLWTPYAELVDQRADEKQPGPREDAQARVYMQGRWGELLEHDPYQNPNLDPDGRFLVRVPPRYRKPWQTSEAG